MEVKALGIFLGKARRVGVLLEYRMPGADILSRFVADEDFAWDVHAPLLSYSYKAANPEEQAAFWASLQSPVLNGAYSARTGWLLPPFFQNLLPEGVFRDHVAALRGCSPNDHFEMLAACGRDLPGNVYARPVDLNREDLTRYVTQNQDALEMTVTAEPMDEGVSLSGVQPKLAVIKHGDRYVGRTKDEDTHIIAKLPVAAIPFLPELEKLSLDLAALAGIDVCEAYLEPLGQLGVQHDYDLGEVDQKTNFLAVVRYDRGQDVRIHCEDFAQVLGVMPDDKYTGATYLDVASVLMLTPSLGEAAVHELLRRLVVNEMLGNPDMHLKNMGLVYPDAETPRLGRAYDIVAYAANQACRGHALHFFPQSADNMSKSKPNLPQEKPRLTPKLIRDFCARLGIPEKPAATVIERSVKAAVATWPAAIDAAAITARQKERLLEHFAKHPMVIGVHKRLNKTASSE